MAPAPRVVAPAAGGGVSLLREAPIPPSTAPSRRARVAVALAVGLLTLAAVRVNQSKVGASLGGMSFGGDYVFTWRAARLLAQGADPYSAMGAGAPYPFNAPFFYPLPAAILGLPLAPLSPGWAMAAFMALAATLLAWGATRDGWWRLPIFLGFPFVYACGGGQYAPLLTAAALTPALGFILVTKPNIGLSLFIWRPSWAAAVGGAALLAGSLLVVPGWPAGWWRAIHDPIAVQYRPPLFAPGGVLLLLALLRWRRPEARLLVALALVPQNMLPYEALALFLVPATLRQMLVLAIASYGAFLVGDMLLPHDPGLFDAIRVLRPLIMLFVFLPALAMVLRRPNVGPLPAWLERWTTALPTWSRGAPSASPSLASDRS